MGAGSQTTARDWMPRRSCSHTQSAPLWPGQKVSVSQWMPTPPPTCPSDCGTRRLFGRSSARSWTPQRAPRRLTPDSSFRAPQESRSLFESGDSGRGVRSPRSTLCCPPNCVPPPRSTPRNSWPRESLIKKQSPSPGAPWSAYFESRTYPASGNHVERHFGTAFSACRHFLFNVRPSATSGPCRRSPKRRSSFSSSAHLR